MKLTGKIKKIPKSWYFLILTIIAYFILLIFYKEIYFESLNFFGDLILKIIPIFIIVFVLMALSNYFITNDFIIKHLKGKGLKKWFFVIVGGILSSGPIYMWYPLLANLKQKGLKDGLIACFLYNRAIKIPLLPLAIVYFNWKYVVILTLVMVIISIIQGILINKLMKDTLPSVTKNKGDKK
jgi:uncharacterized membrane protein YraQ (UPF0718 family)